MNIIWDLFIFIFICTCFIYTFVSFSFSLCLFLYNAHGQIAMQEWFQLLFSFLFCILTTSCKLGFWSGSDFVFGIVNNTIIDLLIIFDSLFFIYGWWINTVGTSHSPVISCWSGDVFHLRAARHVKTVVDHL